MNKTKMKILVPIFMSGQIDLYRYQEFIRPFYPDSKIIIIDESSYLLKIHIVSGKVLIGKSVNFSADYYASNSGCSMYAIELNDRLEDIIKDPYNIMYKSYQFNINNQDISTSLYTITGEFYARTLRQMTFQEAAKMTRISDIKQEVLDNSGIDFILVGKDRILQDIGGITTPIIIEELPTNTDKLEKITLKSETIFVQGRTIFYAIKELSHQAIIFYTLIAYFYFEQSDLSVKYLQEMRKDIDGLLQGLQIKGSVGWEWEIQELDVKRLNFLKYLSFFRSFDSTYSNFSMPAELETWYKINTLKSNINVNLDAVQFTMTEIDRIVEEKQAALAGRRSKNLEYILTLFGGLGGVAAILAALFAGGLKLETRIIAILLLLFIPLAIVLFEYLVRKGITKRSRDLYLDAKINNLLKAKQWYEVMLKSTQEQGKTYPDEYYQFFFARIKRIEEEIEEIDKVK
jgi:hypothetical protein